MLTLTLFAALLLMSLLLSAAVLWVCARIVRAGHPSFKRALACGIVLSVIGLAVQLAGAAFPAVTVANQLFLGCIQLLIVLVLTWFVAAQILRMTFPRSILFSIPYFVLSIPMTIGIVYVVKTYCMEAFVIPTNSMAPTFYGWHHEAICSHCQGKVIIPGRPPDDPDRFGRFPDESTNGICTQCRKISEFTKWPEELHTPICIICNKLMQPQRGDPVVFVYPRKPDPQQKTLYVQRLVGLPGEKIEIKDDAVWIDGQKWTPPADLVGIRFTGRAGFLAGDWPKEPQSWDLGPDDFFVLGDFTTNASDSREWGPVPRANLVGPVTMIYWPQSAWRILR